MIMVQNHSRKPNGKNQFQLEFSFRTLANSQELIKLMDQKAGFLLASVGVLTAAQAAFASKSFEFVPVTTEQVIAKTFAIVATMFYFALAVALLRKATAVFAARPNLQNSGSKAPNLLFSLLLLETYNADEQKYFQALSKSTYSDLLRDYSSQIVQVSRIYKEKQTLVNESLSMFSTLVLLWSISTVMFLVLWSFHR